MILVKVVLSFFSSSLSSVLDVFPICATTVAQRQHIPQDGSTKTFTFSHCGNRSHSISSLDGFGKSFSAGKLTSVAAARLPIAKITAAEQLPN